MVSRSSYGAVGAMLVEGEVAVIADQRCMSSNEHPLQALLYLRYVATLRRSRRIATNNCAVTKADRIMAVHEEGYVGGLRIRRIFMMIRSNCGFNWFINIIGMDRAQRTIIGNIEGRTTFRLECLLDSQQQQPIGASKTAVWQDCVEAIW